jgi:hypothetical protein
MKRSRSGLGSMHGFEGALAVLALAVSATAPSPARAQGAPTCARVVSADVVALDQPLVFNRLGSQNVNGMIFALRRDVAGRGILPWGKRLGMRLAGLVLARPALYRLAGGLARRALGGSGGLVRIGPGATWGRQRAMPKPPAESFREAWKREGP